MLGKDYWSRVVNFEALLEADMIGQADLDLFAFADSAEGAWAELVKRGLVGHTPPPDQPTVPSASPGR